MDAVLSWFFFQDKTVLKKLIRIASFNCKLH